MSASMAEDGTCRIRMLPFFMCWRKKWWPKSMKFLRFVDVVLSATAIAALLSRYKYVGEGGRRAISPSNLRSHWLICTALVAAIYSASHVDRACMVCFVAVHAIEELLNR